MRKLISTINYFLHLFKRVLFKKTPTTATNILIFRTGSIGDMVCALPSIAAVREQYTDAKITLLTNSGNSSHVGYASFADDNLVDVIIDYLSINTITLFKIIKAEKFDLIVQLPQTDARFISLIRDLLFFKFAGIPSGFGWQITTLPILKKHQNKDAILKRESERLLAILEMENISPKAVVYPFSNTNSGELKSIDDYWQNRKLKNRSTIAIVIGAKRSQNRWPIEHFQEIINYLSEYNIFLIGGSDDAALTDKLILPDNAINLCGHLSTLGSLEIIKRCQFTLSNDTGPMHMSYAVGTPVIALFSSRDYPIKWYPPNDGLNIIHRTPNVHCELCFTETCSNNICMQRITVEQVKVSIDKMLSCLQSSV